MNKIKLKLAPSSLKVFNYGDHLRPSRDWLALLSVAGLLLLCSIAWNVWFFINVEQGRVISAADTAKQTEATSSIAAVQTVFQRRATEETNYQHTYQFVDPSLPGS